MSDNERAALREGDSWRAKVYRRKDQVFSFKVEKFMEFLSSHPIENFNETMIQVNQNLVALRDAPDNEDLGKSTLELLDKVESMLKGSGFTFEPTTA